MSHVIEPALTSDFLNVAALDRIAWTAPGGDFIPDGEHVWRIWTEYATVLVARAAGGEALEHSEDIAGAVVMFPTQAGETVLHKIMVHPTLRGQGIGGDLMRAALQRAATTVLLTVDPNNEAAIQLYRNFGFEIRERVDGFYRPHEDRYVMARPGPSGE